MFKTLLKAMRPVQWTKNLVIFAGLIFSQNLFNGAMFLKTVLAFVIFCLLSGSIYIINDLKDIKRDKEHPDKSLRPLASGELSPKVAVGATLVIILISAILFMSLNIEFCIIATSYFVLMIAYTYFLKELVIIDVLAISFGFVLRVMAGVEVIKVYLSPWLIVCTTLLALFLALCKRRNELILLEDKAISHRNILGEYTPKLLDQMISVVTASTVVTYAIYTLSPETVAKFKTSNLIYTIPFVLYGVFRYLYLVYKKELGGAPDEIFLTDKMLITNILLWILVAGLVIYIR